MKTIILIMLFILINDYVDANLIDSPVYPKINVARLKIGCYNGRRFDFQISKSVSIEDSTRIVNNILCRNGCFSCGLSINGEWINEWYIWERNVSMFNETELNELKYNPRGYPFEESPTTFNLIDMIGSNESNLEI